MPEMNTNGTSTQTARPAGAPMRRGPMGRGPMGGGGGKAKDMGGAIRKLISYCRDQVGIIVFALILAAAGAVFTIIGPDQLSRMTDYIYDGLAGEMDMDGITSVALLLMGIYLASAVCNFIQHFIMQTVTQRTAKKLRGDISTKINRLPLKYYNGNAAGDVLSRMTNDVDMIGQAMSNSLSNLVTAVAQFIGCLIMMYYTNWIMATTTVVATLVGLVLMVVIMSHSQKYFTARQESLGELNGYIEEMYNGHDVIRISNAENKVKSKFDTLNEAVKNGNFSSQFLSGLMQPLMTFIGNVGYVAVCIVGAAQIINGNITFG
ncbi:MAG: ABC transporter ATP-binding protein, partial [Clostridiales bacterium]|nr:ABC transporter ATP-binding protein [Clostridiales bacterium]